MGNHTAILSGLLTGALVLLAGCQAGGSIAAGESTLPPGEDSAAFFDRLSSQENVSENDAVRGLLYFVDGKDEAESFTQRVESLRGRGLVSDAWSFDADRPLTRGKLAYMIYQACDIPGGVTLLLTGPSQRYCLRELQYQGFVPPGSGWGPVSGIEYVSVLSRAAAYQETGEIPVTMKVDWRR